MITYFISSHFTGVHLVCGLNLSRPGFRKQLEFVAENVNVQKWRKLVRTLGLDDADIDNVVDQHRTNVRDQILQALLLWTRRCKEQATRTTLIDALNRAQLKLVADRLIDQYPV
jgi:hypothetical protein